MSDFVQKPINNQLNSENPLLKIEKLEAINGARPSASVNELSELAATLGDVIGGRIISPAEDSSSEPTDADFSGAFLAGEPQTPADGAGQFNFGIIELGATIYGVGLGGEYANGLGFTGYHKATGSSGNIRRLLRGFEQVQGNTDPSYKFQFGNETAGTNLITTNPDFSGGDSTGWTMTDFAVQYIASIGDYFAVATGDPEPAATLYSDKYTCAAGNILLCSARIYKSDAYTTFSVRFYDAGSALLSTTSIPLTTATNYIYNGYVIVPSGATQFDVLFTHDFYGVGAYTYINDVSVSVSSVNNYIGFYGTDGKIMTKAEDGEYANIGFGNGRIARPPKPFLVLDPLPSGNLDPNAVYKYKYTYVNSLGEETLPSDEASITTTASNKSVYFYSTGQCVGSNSINIYRTEGGGSTFYYLKNGISSFESDGAFDTDLDTSRTPPTYNNTTSRPFYPSYCFVSPYGIQTRATMTLLLGTGGPIEFPFNFRRQTNPADAIDGDTYVIPIFLAAGIYTLIIHSIKSTDKGKVDLYFDGTSIATGVDIYAGTAAYFAITVTTVTVSTSGHHQLVIIINGKNASSSDYGIGIAGIEMYLNGKCA
jgi:hypothetical protein